MKKNCKYDVTAVGEVLIDFATVATAPDGYPTMAANPGGAPANFLAALSKYGCKTSFIGKVGDDTFGKLLIGTLADAGIETKGVVVDPDHFTTLAFVTFDEHGDRSFAFSRKPGADTCLHSAEIDKTMIAESRVFHFGTLSFTDEPARSAVMEAVEYAKASGCLITFDPNLRRPLWSSLNDAKDAMLWGLLHADAVKISDDEVEFLWGSITPEEAASKLLNEYGVSLAMITLGKNGAHLANKNASVTVPTPPADTIDTTGAGDIFGGSAVSRILSYDLSPSELSENELYKIAAFASAAASLSTEVRGGIPSIPDIEKVEKYIY